MKKLLIICFALVVSTNWTFCQEFESIVDTNKMWVVLRNSAGVNSPFYNGGDSFAYKIKDSSLVADEYWMKLWESSDSIYLEWIHKGYMKESDSIVLFMDLSSNIDALYDFTKTTDENLVIDDCEIPAVSTDTTEFIGKDRLTMNIIGHTWYDVKHYEGIGSNAGLLSPLYYCLTGACYYLICYYENGEKVYHNDKFNSCNYNVTSVVELYNKDIKIYPNPIVDKLQIDNIEIGTLLTIFNSQGQNIYSKKLTNQDNSLILPDFKGLCFIQLSSKTGEIIYAKTMIK